MKFTLCAFVSRCVCGAFPIHNINMFGFFLVFLLLPLFFVMYIHTYWCAWLQFLYVYLFMMNQSKVRFSNSWIMLACFDIFVCESFFPFPPSSFFLPHFWKQYKENAGDQMFKCFNGTLTVKLYISTQLELRQFCQIFCFHFHPRKFRFPWILNLWLCDTCNTFQVNHFSFPFWKLERA